MIPVIDLHADSFSKRMAYDRHNIFDKCYIKIKNNFYSLESSFHINDQAVKQGNLRVQTQSLYIDDAEMQYPFKAGMMMIQKMLKFVQDHDEYIIIRNQADLDRCLNGEKYGIQISIEGLEVLENNLDLLDIFHELGVRIIAPTWNRVLPYMMPVGCEGGLLKKGKRLIEKMNNWNCLIDVSHMSEGSFFDVEREFKGIMIASHSNPKTLNSHQRNLTDDQVKVIQERGGVMGINLAPAFIEPIDKKSDNGLEWIYGIVDYVCSNFSEDIIAFGCDFDGIMSLPPGIKDCSFFSELNSYLSQKGFSNDLLEKLYYKNAERVIKSVLP